MCFSSVTAAVKGYIAHPNDNRMLHIFNEKDNYVVFIISYFFISQLLPIILAITACKLQMRILFLCQKLASKIDRFSITIYIRSHKNIIILFAFWSLCSSSPNNRWYEGRLTGKHCRWINPWAGWVAVFMSIRLIFSLPMWSHFSCLSSPQATLRNYRTNDVAVPLY